LTLLEAPCEPRRALLSAIERHGPRSPAEPAPAVGVSYGAMREPLAEVTRREVERSSPRPADAPGDG